MGPPLTPLNYLNYSIVYDLEIFLGIWMYKEFLQAFPFDLISLYLYLAQQLQYGNVYLF